MYASSSSSLKSYVAAATHAPSAEPSSPVANPTARERYLTERLQRHRKQRHKSLVEARRKRKGRHVSWRKPDVGVERGIPQPQQQLLRQRVHLIGPCDKINSRDGMQVEKQD